MVNLAHLLVFVFGALCSSGITVWYMRRLADRESIERRLANWAG